MDKEKFKKLVLQSLSALAICFWVGGCVPKEEYQRVVVLSESMQKGSLFTAETHNGAIQLRGGETGSCDLTVTITAWADTQENAQKLAEKVKVKLLPTNEGLRFVIEKPSVLVNKSVGVAIEGTVPNKVDLQLTTHNGSVGLVGIAGNIRAITHNGAVSCQNTSGESTLTTHNGKITCTEISGDLQLKTHNGGIKVFYSPTATLPNSIDAVTHNGSIRLRPPGGFSGDVDLSTHNGSISTNLPVTVIGKISKSSVKGKIGTGKSRLRLETHNGSITIE
jgi:hypothetical protein